MPMLLSIDPGKRIGWCLFNDIRGIEVARGIIDWDELVKLLVVRDDYLTPWLAFDDYPIDEVVCEDYIGRPGQKNGGQHFDGPEVLGAVRMLCAKAEVPFVRQRAVDVLKVSAMHAGYTLPKGHLPDDVSAWLHGRYRLEQLGVLRAVPLD